MSVSTKPCTDIFEYHHKDFGCKNCSVCIKGTGINRQQKINRTKYGMMSCYSCYKCQFGTYQNVDHVIKTCKPCNSCTNQKILRNCSTTENAICGNCMLGHQVKYVNGSEICEKIGNSNERAYMFSTICLSVFCLLLVLVIIWLKKKELLKIFDSDKSKRRNCFNQENKLKHHGQKLIPDCVKNQDEISEDKKIFAVVDEITFALNIGKDWTFVAHQLGFTVAEIEEIENDEKQLRDRGLCMLRKYRQKHWPQNDEPLIKALKKINRYDLLEQKKVSSEVEPSETDVPNC